MQEKTSNGEENHSESEEEEDEDFGFGSDSDSGDDPIDPSHSNEESTSKNGTPIDDNEHSGNFSTSSFGESFSDGSTFSNSSFSTGGGSAYNKFNKGVKDRKNKKKKQGKTNTLLASYYGLSAPDEDETKDIDSVHFSAKQYTEEMLTKEGVYSLLKIDDDMVQEIRRLDCDMQSLVYENYSKFISATDTIRLMKTNIDGMKDDMTSLVDSMDGIAEKMSNVNSVLGEKRTKVDKLVAVRNLLKNVEKIFDLPIYLKKSISIGQYAMAVLTYKDAKEVLQNYQNIPSFASIVKDCTVIIDNLKEDLIRRMKIDGSKNYTERQNEVSIDHKSKHEKDPLGSKSVDTKVQNKHVNVALSPTQLQEYIEILIELGVPKKKLQSLVCAAIRNRFLSTLNQFRQQEEERQKIMSISMDDRQTGIDESMIQSIMSGLKNKVLNECLEILKIYLDAFDESTILYTMDKAKEGKDQGMEELIQTIREIFKPFFEFVCYCFRSYLLYYTDQRYSKLHRAQQLGNYRGGDLNNENMTENENQETSQSIPTRSQTRPILDTIKTFLFDMKEAHSLLPSAGFLSDAVLLLSDIVNAIIFIEMKALQGITMKRILKVYSNISPSTYSFIEVNVDGQNNLKHQELDEKPPPLMYKILSQSFFDSLFLDLQNSMEYICPYVALVEFLGKAELSIFLEETMPTPGDKRNVDLKHHRRKDSLCSNLNIPRALTDHDLLGVYTYCLQYICWCFDLLERIAGVSTRLLEGDVVDLFSEPNSVPAFNDANNNFGNSDKSNNQNNIFDTCPIKRSIFPESFFQDALSFSSLLTDAKYASLVNNESTNIPTDLCSQESYHSKQFLIFLTSLSSFMCDNKTKDRKQVHLLSRLNEVLSKLYPELDFPPNETTSRQQRLIFENFSQSYDHKISSSKNQITVMDIKPYILSSKNRLVRHLVDVIGNEIAFTAIDIYKTSSKNETMDYINRCSWSKVILFSLNNIQSELCKALNLNDTDVQKIGSLRNMRLIETNPSSRNTVGSSYQMASHATSRDVSNILNASRSYMSNISFDLQPMFSSKAVSIHGPTFLNLESINSSILKLSIKAVMEHIRNSPGLTQVDFLQIQLEFCLMRYCVPFLLTGKECMIVETLLDDVMRSGGQRCMISPQSIDSQPVTQLLIEEINNVIKYVK